MTLPAKFALVDDPAGAGTLGVETGRPQMRLYGIPLLYNIQLPSGLVDSNNSHEAATLWCQEAVIIFFAFLAKYASSPTMAKNGIFLAIAYSYSRWM